MTIDPNVQRGEMQKALRAYAEKTSKAAAVDLLQAVANVTLASKVPDDSISAVIAATGATTKPGRMAAADLDVKAIYNQWNQNYVRSDRGKPS